MKKSTKLYSRCLAAVSVALLLGLAWSGCVVVEEENDCLEGSRECDGDEVEECIDDTWIELEDCYELCGGTCVYVEREGPACLC